MKPEEIRTEWEAFIEHSDHDRRYVTMSSVLIFAGVIAKMAAQRERDTCYEIAQSSLENTNLLMSIPPKSAAAWEIAARIQARNEANL